MPRPKKPESVQVRISAETLALLDFQLRQAWRLRQTARILSGDKSGPDSMPDSVLADARREFLEHMLEEECGADAQGSVRVKLPQIAGSATDLRKALEWQREQEKRLTEDAPAAVKVAIEAKEFFGRFARLLAEKEE